jgi:hypothetical protein
MLGTWGKGKRRKMVWVYMDRYLDVGLASSEARCMMGSDWCYQITTELSQEGSKNREKSNNNK